MPHTNPINEIEERKSQNDLGALAFNVYTGARAAGASRSEARAMVKAFFSATLQATAEADNDTPEEDNR